MIRPVLFTTLLVVGFAVFGWTIRKMYRFMAGGRPDLLVTGALHDPRVMVHEPAKWVARLRETDPDWSPRCLFRVETGAGSHSGPSGRFGHLGYEAEVYAWVLDRMGLAT